MKDDLNFYIQFIQEIERHPCLYDYQHDDYNNKKITELAWGIVGNIFGEHGSDCKSKWRSIRSSYIRSLNTKSKGSGASTKKAYYLSPYLSFLNPFVKSRSQVDNTNPPTPNESAEDSMDSVLEEISDIKQESPQEDLQVELDATSYDDSTSQQEHNGATTNKHTDPLCTNTIRIHQGNPHIVRRKFIKRRLDRSAIDYIKRKRIIDQESARRQNRDSCEMFVLSLVPHLKSMTERQQLQFQKGVAELIEKIKYSES